MIDAEDSEVIVAHDDHKIIGSAYISIRPAKGYLKHTCYGYLGFMYVDPNYRGRGVNKMIIEGLKEWAHSKKIKELRLEVYNENIPALRAYEKAGFSNHIMQMRMDIG